MAGPTTVHQERRYQARETPRGGTTTTTGNMAGTGVYLDDPEMALQNLAGPVTTLFGDAYNMTVRSRRLPYSAGLAVAATTMPSYAPR